MYHYLMTITYTNRKVFSPRAMEPSCHLIGSSNSKEPVQVDTSWHFFCAGTVWGTFVHSGLRTSPAYGIIPFLEKGTESSKTASFCPKRHSQLCAKLRLIKNLSEMYSCLTASTETWPTLQCMHFCLPNLTKAIRCREPVGDKNVYFVKHTA